MFKQIAHITIAITAFWIGFSQLSVYGYFLVNQAEITELFCINKDKPRLKCDGKCHLKTTMEATAETNTGEVAPAMVWTEVYFPSDEVKELKGVETIHKVPSFKSGSDPTDSGYSLSIPDPPKVG